MVSKQYHIDILCIYWGGTDLAAWQSNHSSTSSSSGAFSWKSSERGSVSSSSDSPPHASSNGTASRVIPSGGRKLKFRSATPSPPLMSGSAPANFSGSLHKFHPSIAVSAKDDGIASDESISECDEEHSPSQV